MTPSSYTTHTVSVVNSGAATTYRGVARWAQQSGYAGEHILYLGRMCAMYFLTIFV